MPELEYVECALCEKNNTELVLKAYNTHGTRSITNETFNLVKCRNCGLLYVNPRPTENEIRRFYDIGYYDAGKGVKKFLEKFIIQFSNLCKKSLITKYKQSGKLLDVGCGSGGFLSSFSFNDGWYLYGVEPNSEGFDLSSKKIKGQIFNDKLVA